MPAEAQALSKQKLLGVVAKCLHTCTDEDEVGGCDAKKHSYLQPLPDW